MKLENDINDSIDSIHSSEESINKFEKEWCKWSVDDTVEWFKFIIAKEKCINVNYNKFNCNKIGARSDNEQESDSKYERNNIEPNWDQIGTNLGLFNFRAKVVLSGMNHEFLEHFGVENKDIRQMLLKNISQLTRKYPKNKK